MNFIQSVPSKNQNSFLKIKSRSDQRKDTDRINQRNRHEEYLMKKENITGRSYFNNSHKARLSIADYFYNLELDQSRTLYHLTVTYCPYKDRDYRESDVNKFFINFYTRYYLTKILKINNFHRTSKKLIQPITFAFIDEHNQDVYSDRLHHHAIIALHQDHTDLIDNLDEIFINKASSDKNQNYIQKIQSAAIRKCESTCVLYASKKYSKYPDFLSFPDKMYQTKTI